MAIWWPNLCFINVITFKIQNRSIVLIKNQFIILEITEQIKLRKKYFEIIKKENLGCFNSHFDVFSFNSFSSCVFCKFYCFFSDFITFFF